MGDLMEWELGGWLKVAILRKEKVSISSRDLGFDAKTIATSSPSDDVVKRVKREDCVWKLKTHIDVALEGLLQRSRQLKLRKTVISSLAMITT